MTPIELLTTWIEEEKAMGAKNAQHAVLSTQGLNSEPHARVVAIREMSEDWILFFTQKRTRKVEEITNNGQVALTFWLERYAREVIVEGEAHFLSEEQNNHYWLNYPKSAQIRFYSYAPTSGLVINNKQILENKKRKIERESNNISLPCSTDYCGITIQPNRFIFYTYRVDELSDVWDYSLQGQHWVKKLLSP